MKLLIITGASSGIGLHCAEKFLGAGYSVINLSRRRCPIDAVAQVNCDLASPGFTDHITAQLVPALQEAEEIVLLHNASRLDNDSSVETPSNTLREILEVNLVAPNSLNYLIIPYMKAGSSILFVGSTLAEKAVPGSFTYVTTKHAQIGMMRSLTQDLVGRGVHTACICPGFTDTEMLRKHVGSENLEFVANLSAFKRLIEPDEIASTLHFAAISPVLNGSVIHANLGQVEA